MAGATVTFNYLAWIARYPEFAAVTEPLAQAYFDEATLYFNNQGWTASLSQASVLLNMLTAHLAWLYSARDAQGNPSSTGTTPAPATVGRVNSAGEGSVNVGFELNGSGAPSEAFFTQTKYGFSFWQAVAQFRTMQYAARPTIVGNGTFPFARPFRGW